MKTISSCSKCRNHYPVRSTYLGRVNLCPRCRTAKRLEDEARMARARERFERLEKELANE
jgi:predicted nucleic-acid-binding Zn-ribbon protein